MKFQSLWCIGLICLPSVSVAQSQVWDMGLAITSTTSPFAGGNTQNSAKPVIIDTTGFEIRGPAYSFHKTAQREWYIGIGLDDWDHKRGNSAQLRDMDKLKQAVNVRVGHAWQTQQGAITAEVAQDVTAHKGAHAKVRYTHNGAKHHTRIRPYVETQWLSNNLTQYYVGVKSSEITTQRTAYRPKDAIALKVGITAEKRITPKLTAVAGADITGYNSSITDSPIISKDAVWGSYAGLTYRW